VTVAARLHSTSPADRRIGSRRKLRLDLSLEQTGDAVTIHDISATGMLIETRAELAAFDAFEIDFPEAGIAEATVVWNSGSFYGCQFHEGLSKAAVSAALLRSVPAPTSSALSAELAATAGEGDAPHSANEDSLLDEGKARLSVRLRVIVGSAILLWALIIWAIGSLIKFVG
jgi:PilZ domain